MHTILYPASSATQEPSKETQGYSPVQWNRHSAQPSSQHRANQPPINLIDRQQQGHNLPPRLTINTMYIYQGERAKQRNVSTAEKRLRMVRGNGRAEEDEGSREERSRGEGSEEEG
jgi:hypothetical protein